LPILDKPIAIHMDDLYQNLHAEGIISDESFKKIRDKNANPLFSLHWEIKVLLYVGVLL
jgi:hypothetical protein